MIRLFLVLYLIGVPFYVFRSGVPQPVHYLLFGLILVLLSRGPELKIPRRYESAFIWLTCFVAYTVVVNVTYSFLHADGEPIFDSIYFVYNTVFLITLMAAACLDRLRFLRSIQVGLTLTLGLQTLLALFGLGAQGVRATMFFNNPNQLGYFAILCGTAVVVISRVIPIPTVHKAVLYGCVTFLSMISLSKAALVACAILFTVVYLQAQSRSKLILALLLAINLLFASVVELKMSRWIDGNDLKSRVWSRVSSIGEQADDNLEARRYDRIVRYPQYLVFGAGKGVFERFERKGEIHGSLASILFSYGLVGSGLFLMFIWRVLLLCRLKSALIWLPVFFYGITHNGIRQTLLWLLVCLMIVVADEERTRSAGRDPAGLAFRGHSEPLSP